MITRKIALFLSVVIACQFGFAQQSQSLMRTYGSNDVQEVVLKAAEEGNASAQAELGNRFFLANPPDYDNAIKWFRKAAEQGNALGQYGLGSCYEKGKGVGKDEAEAVKWYQKAAEQGESKAQHDLGVRYQLGSGVGKDEIEAFRWFCKSAEQGDSFSQSCVGRGYEFGRGVGKNEAEAVKWYRKSAEQGNALGQYGLGSCYEKGKGVGKDEAEAVKWYQKAAGQGLSLAQKKCKEQGVMWNVKESDRIREVDEKRLEELKAKAELAKSSAFVFKSLYIGMPIQEAAELLRYYMGKAGSGKVSDILIQNYSDGRCFLEEESGIRVTSTADSKVNAIYLSKKAVDIMFDTKGVDVKSFIKTFQRSYSLDDFLYTSTKLPFFTKNSMAGKTVGIQPIISLLDLGVQATWTATEVKGCSVTVYGEPTVFDQEKLLGFLCLQNMEAIPCGSILIRKINTAAFD